jgi:hypothetical protein
VVAAEAAAAVVVGAAAAAGAEAASREEVGVRAVASPAEVVAIAGAVADALRRCRDHPRAHRQLIDRVAAEEVLPAGQATVICQRQVVGRAAVSGIVRVVVRSRIVQVRVDRALVLALVLEHGRASAGARVLETLQVADVRRPANCRIFLICQTSGVEISAPAGHLPGHQVAVATWRPESAARLPEARPRSF